MRKIWIPIVAVLLSAAALFATYQLTLDLRHDNQQKQLQEKMETLLPGSINFVQEEYTGEEVEFYPEEAYTEEYVEDENHADTNYRYFNIQGKQLKVPGWLFTILVCVVSFFVLTFIFALITRLVPFFFLIMLGIMMYRFVRNMFR